MVLSIDWLPYNTSQSTNYTVGDCCRINEIEFYDNNMAMIPRDKCSVINAYDTVQNGKPLYWNNPNSWGIVNIFSPSGPDNICSHYTTGIICLSYSIVGVLKWGEVLIKINPTGIEPKKVKIYIGDPYAGNPDKIVFSRKTDTSIPILNASKFSERSDTKILAVYNRDRTFHYNTVTPITLSFD